MLSSSVIVVVLLFGDLIHPDENHTMADAVNGRDLHTQWDITTGRRAKFYTLTKAGRRQLTAEEESWDLLALAVAKVRQAT